MDNKHSSNDNSPSSRQKGYADYYRHRPAAALPRRVGYIRGAVTLLPAQASSLAPSTAQSLPSTVSADETQTQSSVTPRATISTQSPVIEHPVTGVEAAILNILSVKNRADAPAATSHTESTSQVPAREGRLNQVENIEQPFGQRSTSAPRHEQETQQESDLEAIDVSLDEKDLNAGHLKFLPQKTVAHAKLKPEDIKKRLKAAKKAAVVFISHPNVRVFRRRSVWIPALSATVVVVSMTAYLLVALSKNNDKRAEIAAVSQKSLPAVLSDSTEVPVETIPTLTDSKVYTVAPKLAKTLSIPELHLKSRVLRSSVSTNNEIQVPRNIHDVVWFDGSALPTDATGASLLIGHAQGPTQPGAFSELSALSAGDEIMVGMGDNTTVTYRVVSVEPIDESKFNINDYLVSKVAAKPGLNMITCVCRFEGSVSSDTSRQAVFAIREKVEKPEL